MYGETGFIRRPGRRNRPNKYEFVNPYPEMSDIEAMVFLFLQGLQVPFSWRKFDGQSSAPNFTGLMPTFNPEFTMSESRTVILIIGAYWGTLPGILDLNAMALALLKEDGWNVVLLWESDILRDLSGAIFRDAPHLAGGLYQGGPKNFPTANDGKYLERLRGFIRANNFKRTVWLDMGARWVEWSSIRKPRRSDRRGTQGIVREQTPEDQSWSGVSTLNGRFIDRSKAATRRGINIGRFRDERGRGTKEN